MTKRTLFAGGAAAPFAHLFGGRPGKAAKPGRAEDEKEDKEVLSAEDEDEEKEANKAEEPDDPPEEDKVAETEDDEEKEAAKPKGKRKAKADDEDDETCAEEDSDDDEVSAAAASGRRAERARCANIFRCEAAAARPDVAAQLAFTTNMSSAEAIGVLNTVAMGGTATPKVSALHARMSRVRQPDTGSDTPEAAKPSGAKGAAAAILAAVNKARPTAR